MAAPAGGGRGDGASPPPRVLIIDDNQLDAQLLREAFAEAGFMPAVAWAPTGPIGLQFLSHFRHGDGPLLVVLDLNLPAVPGLEILRTIRADPQTRTVPVLIFTTSTLAADREQCLALGVVDVVRKPSTFSEYVGVVDRIRAGLGVLPRPEPVIADEG